MPQAKKQSTTMMSRAEEAALTLRSEIREGKYNTGQQLSDEYALATRLGVSRGTLRQALDILSGERLIIRQKGRGTFVSDVGAAEGTQAAMLGIMVYDKQYYFGGVIHGASTRATNRGYILTTGSNSSPDERKRCTDAFLKNAIKGVIIAPQPDEPPDEYLRLKDAGVQVVLIDRIVPGLREDFISVDDHQGTRIATEHLLELGHTKLAYVGSEFYTDIPCQPNRYHGFMDTCRQAGLTIPKEWRLQVADDCIREPLDKVLRAKDRPTAFVTFSDHYAMRVIATARELGLGVPEDLSVIGFDDSEMARNNYIPITSIHPEFEQIGAASIDLLIDKITCPPDRSPRSTLIAPRLIVRQSTGQPPK